MGFFGRRPHNIKGAYDQQDLPLLALTLITWQHLSGFSTPFGRKLPCTAHTAVWETMCHLDVSTEITQNSSEWEICFFSSSYLCVQSFISAWTYGYLFYTLQCYFILLPFDFCKQHY